MKRISLQNISLLNVEPLSKDYLKDVLGGSAPVTSTGCTVDSIGLCGRNCMRPGGAADKCGFNAQKACTCGGV